MNLQDTFINHIRTNKITVEVTLATGDRISGTLRGFDAHVIVLDCNDTDAEQPSVAILYKAQVVSVMPDQPVDLFCSEPGPK